MGKYSNLKKELTKLELEPSYQDRIDSKKTEVRKMFERAGEPISVGSFGMFLVDARIEKNRLEELVKEQNLIIAAMEQELIDSLEGSDMMLIRMNNGVTLSINDDVYCQVSDKSAFHRWVRDSHLEDLFSVHYQTMASMVKEKLMDGDEVPPGITPYFKQSIRVLGVKNLEREGQ